MHLLFIDIFQSFIHSYRYLYSASSRKLLEALPTPSRLKLKVLRLGKKVGYRVLGKRHMYVCMYPYMYLCFMYVSMYVSMYNYMISENKDGRQCLTTLCMHACMHVCMHVCMYVCIHTYMHACMHA